MSTLGAMVERSEADAGPAGQAPGVAAPLDRASFEGVYRRHYRLIAQYIYRRVGDVHTAEDLAAETFIDAWRGLGRYRVTGVPLEHWLLRIATNRVHRWGRKQRRKVGGLGPRRPEGEVVEACACDVQGALRALSSSHQDVLYLHHVEELSVEAVSSVLGCGAGTVKSRLHRAREALRRELERLEVES